MFLSEMNTDTKSKEAKSHLEPSEVLVSVVMPCLNEADTP